jgi:2-polyprenyl-6-methoxyphenol hydroxylase-like FAD-dependent oxidoreductase
MEKLWDTKANLTLIGDAAHLMPPNGEGVNLAMLDALDLSNCLCDERYPTIQAAIAAYEGVMFDRALSLSQETVEGIRDFAAPTDESVHDLIKMMSSESSDEN